MRVVPRAEVLEKLAALRHADALGRQLAQDRAVEKLASLAGVFMAHGQDESGLEKLAQSMVHAGQLSPDEYEMLKEAGYIGLLAKKLGRKVVGAGKAVTGVKSRVRSAVKRSKPLPDQSKWTTPAGKVKPKAAGPMDDWSWSGASQPASPGRVKQAPQAAKQTTRKVPQSTQKATQAPASQAAAEGVQAAAQGTQAKTNPQAKGMGWGRALPYAGVGALGYGLYKGVPWAARQMEQASTTPMAYGAGWSPVQYGYGRSQYGPSVAPMGSGA